MKLFGRPRPGSATARKGRRRHSLRAKLTAVNVLLLALGVAAATAVSLMGMRHYLLDKVDTELVSSRQSLELTGLTRQQIEALGAVGSLRDQLAQGMRADGSPPRPGMIFAAVDARGRALSFAGVPPTPEQHTLVAALDDPVGMARTQAGPRDVEMDGDSYRAVGARLGDDSVVVMAASTQAVHVGIRQALKLDLAFGALLVLLLTVLTLVGTRRSLRPLEDMVETASAIAEGDLTRRVPAGQNPVTEIEQLRLALNSMLHQVESAFDTRERSSEQLRRFVADASHELRTPLSAIRGYLQLYDRGILHDPDERTRVWGRTNAEVDRMGRLVEELLTLARLDQEPELQLRNVDLSRLVRDAAQDLRAQQPDRPVSVSADGAILVRADESGLRKVVGNLMGNIRAHTPLEAAVSIGLARSEGMVRLTVADEGPGLSSRDASRIFDRFFRTGGSPGSGLGMAIVQGVVAAHGGEVAVATEPAAGLTVTVSLPAEPVGVSRGDVFPGKRA
ncbi:putative sensor histidine kinase TcrY [Streptomyces sp. YIM 130001]|uniref:sensor histidine kinase n=1 Tax=Streptomyces sp. YIM 130001 TaxID=2259644 RepID=UPI000E65528F|nr:HAMP domain-containing sensor histidine kinase [Streptomyces sp. YIM 130001]RII20821.1 putative sensor histidine kinase TcrY [Streptomyces sp. YIM 130001]